MSERKLVSKGKFFTKRGRVEKSFEMFGESVVIDLRVLTNREVDEMMNEFSDISGGEADIDMAGIIEERIMKCVIDIGIDFGDGKTWKDLTEKERRDAISEMEPRFREKLSKEIMGQNSLSLEEKNFLRKQSSPEQ